VVALLREGGRERRVFVRASPNGWVLLMREGELPVRLRGLSRLASHLPRRAAETVAGILRAAFAAASGQARREGAKRETRSPLRVSAVATLEDLRRLGAARYVPLEVLERALGRETLELLEGGVPVIACHGRRAALVDLEALLSYAAAERALGELASGQPPRETQRDLEVLERHGLVKRLGGAYVMPKSALALFPLSEELLRSVVFVPDAVYRGIPRHGEPGGGEGTAGAGKAARRVR
jgi:hypothetical protein